MSIAALIRSMGAAGANVEAIALAVEALEAAQVRPPRGASADRMARKRERDRASVTSDAAVTSQVTTGDGSDVTPPLPLPLSPQTPQTPTPSPGDSPSRARDGLAAKAEKVAHLRQAFEHFWADYPRKVAKPNAERAYAKALGRIGGADAPATILDGLRRHLGGWATGDPEYVPHAATWLNRDGWNDEAESPRQPRLVHDRTSPHPDRRATAYAERLSAFSDAADAAMR